MPRIDPQQLLSCLAVLLNPNGGIRSTEEVTRLASLMTKYSKNLVSKCVYILILKNTETELLGRFMSAGGWNLTHLWLTNGIVNKNWALVSELLELMLMCPVDVERLKANNCPKLVKGLSKEGGPEGVRILAGKLVEQWLKVVKGETQAGSTINDSSLPSTALTNSAIVKDQLTTMVEAQSGVQSESVNSEIVDNLAENNHIQANDTNQTAQTVPVLRIQIRDGKQIVAKVDDNNKADDDTNVASVKVDKEKSSSRDRDKERTKHSSSNKHSSSSKSSSSNRKSSSSSSNSSSSHKNKDHKSSSSSSSSKHKDKDKDRDRSKHKISNSSSSSSNKSSSKENKEKQAEKDKATLAKIQPQSISKIGRIPKKPPSDDEKKKSLTTGTKPDVKKPSISIENRKSDSDNRPKTVKVFNAKMRSTGLEEEAKPAPPRPVAKKLPPPKRVSPPRETIKDMAHPPEKKAKIEMTNGDVERPGGIKLIAPKPKPPVLQECGLFMDAMVAASTKKDPKKRKRRISGSKEDGPKSKSPPNSPSVTSPVALKPTAPKFYKDTLELDDEAEIKTENSETSSDLDDAKPEKDDAGEIKDEISSPNDTKDDLDDLKINIEHDRSELHERKIKEERIPGGVLVYHKRKGPKKAVKWKADSELEDIQYFELDETERVNVTKTFLDMKQMDMCGEREALQMSRKLPNEDLMDERTKWRALIPVDIHPPPAPIVIKSKEKEIQYAREKVILQVIYFNRSLIPDSPTEPDVEHHPMEDPVVIPLDDVADNVKDYTSIPWPEAKGEGPRSQNQMPIGAPFMQNQPFMGPPNGPPFGPPFGGQPGFMNEMMGENNWQPGNRGMGMPSNVPMPPPNMFPMGVMPPNIFPGPGPGPDNFNMPPNMNGPGFPPGDFPPGGPRMFNDGGFPGNRGGGKLRGRGRNIFDTRCNNGPNNWKGRNNWNNRGICKHFQKGGYCRQGDNCQFLHPGVNCPPF